MTTSTAPERSDQGRHPSGPAIVVQDLTKTYGHRRILDGVTFDVSAGEIFGLLGTNGAGKTTTVEIVQGLRSRDGGDVRVLGCDPATDRARLRGLIGAQLQSSALPDRLKVDEALRLFARLAGDVVDWRRMREEWGLAHLARSPFGSLSGGERQRLFVALALVNRPVVVFLDELTQGLDPAARRDTWRIVERVRDHGASVVLVTHDMEEAEHLCDRVAVLHEGRIAAAGTPGELVDAVGGPVRTRFTAARSSDLAGLDNVPGVHGIDHDGRTAEVCGDAASAVRVAAELFRRGLEPVDFTVLRPSLNDVFLTMTGGPR